MPAKTVESKTGKGGYFNRPRKQHLHKLAEERKFDPNRNESSYPERL